jgi:hypothetical protein
MKLIGICGTTHQDKRHIIFHLTCKKNDRTTNVLQQFGLDKVTSAAVKNSASILSTTL